MRWPTLVQNNPVWVDLCNYCATPITTVFNERGLQMFVGVVPDLLALHGVRRTLLHRHTVRNS
jgi:hypothetical protein